MKDCFGRQFAQESIRNIGNIGFIEPKALEELSQDEIDELVFITDERNGNRLYLLSDLTAMLKANYNCRLEDPFTRKDILEQVPSFAAALELEKGAAQYNAQIFDDYPEFIPLLITYVKEVLHQDDERALLGTKKNQIRANTSEKLDQFYEQIAAFPEEKKVAFFSLFITNRRATPFTGGLWTMPALWKPCENDAVEKRAFQWLKKTGDYKEFPHRNVVVGDLISDPESACMHSWGMDVLHLLLEYHIGKNRPFTVFMNNKTDAENIKMERLLRLRLEATMQPEPLPRVENEKNADSLRDQLDDACRNYMDYILSRLMVHKGENYPSMDELASSDETLSKKYQAVHELHISLNATQPDNTVKECIATFKNLFNEQERQDTLKQHRDSAGIRFLSLVSSILTFGVKNAITWHCSKGYYCGFWNSRGAAFNDKVGEILSKSLDNMP